MTEEHKKKIGESNSISLLGHIPWNKGGGGYSTSRKGTKDPEISKRMMGGNNPMFGKYGSLHHRWTGKTSLNKNIRNSDKYVEWRSSIYQRDEYTCQDCGLIGSNKLNAHHIKPLRLLLVENNIDTIEQALKCKNIWNISNGITLCKKCHKKIHRRII